MNRDDEVWMKRCITLARRGIGNVSPNPLVGAVIVRDGKKISEGYHERFGSHHAEVNAILNALAAGKDLRGSTIYVNLEPCYHQGKTPPCVDALLRHGFSRVVIAVEDPNPLVAGKSIKKLRKHGVQVNVGLLRTEAVRLNEKFFKYIRTNAPYVALKAAQTADGYIARSDGTSKWITNARSRRFVHRLRNEYDAVLVGATTVINDDPQLTVRTVKGRNPVRVVIDGNCTVPASSRVFNADAKTIIYISQRSALLGRKKILVLQKKGVEVVRMKERKGCLSVTQIFDDLAARRIASILIEGGQRTFTECVNARLVDKFCLFTAEKKFGSGIKTFGEISVSFKKRMTMERYFDSDRYREFSIEYR